MKEIIKKRDIHVEEMTCGGCERNIDETLSAIDGVKDVKVDRKGSVHIKYDLMKVNLQCIEEKIKEINFRLGTGFFDRLKRGFINFTEENERGNMNAAPHSCCTIPEEHNH